METNTKKITAGKVVRAVLLGLLMLLSLTILIGWAVGYKAFIVDGASMEPIIHYRSLVVDYKKAAEDIQIGDAITYKVTGIITHRLVRVKTSTNDIIAEFRDMADYEASWEEDGAYLVEREDLGVDVVIWYSGTVFTEDMTFVTQGTDTDINPLASNASLENVTYSQIEGIVLFSIPNLGNVIIFIQKNVILIVATFAALILLYNMVYNEVKSKK